MGIVASGLGALLGLVVVTAHAQLYSCRDAAGRHIVSDRPIPECANRAVREVRKDGIFKREIAAPLSADERRRQEENELEAQRIARQQKEAKQRDQALLLRFKTSGDIAAARNRDLEAVYDRIRYDRPSYEAAQRQLVEAQAALHRAGDKASLSVRDRAERMQENVDQKKRQLEQHDRDIAAINRRYDEIALRFRQLMESDIEAADVVRVSAEATSRP